MCWKIVRINGDGSIRITYNGKNGIKNANNAYIGISYFNSNESSSYAEFDKASGVLIESDIKLKLDEWFKTNFDDYQITNFIADAGFCNDRSVSDDGTYLVNQRDGNNSPQLFCNNSSNDLFTVKNLKGNNLLKYPIGLITYDELKFAGISTSIFNKSSWIQDNYSYWTITPKGKDENFFLSLDGIISKWSSRTNYAIRPVISLKPDVKITGGIGTVNDPFIIDTNN